MARLQELYRPVMAASLLFLGTDAVAQTIPLAGAMVLSEETATFDLARDCRRPSQPVVDAQQPEPVVLSWETDFFGLSAKQNLRPRWSHELETGGPRIEFGTFGEGRQFNRPKLAHLAFDWQF